MKNIHRYLLILFAVLPFMVQAHVSDLDIPKAIQSKLDSLYPQATHVDWQKEGQRYQADFVYKDKCVSIVFKKDGDFVYFRQEIERKDLPAAVSESIKTMYLDKGYKIAYLMTRWNKGDYEHQKIYEVEVIKGRRLYISRFNAKGDLLTVYEIDKRDILSSPIVP
ncbi:MAG: hypothetical protein JWO58_339 [Chitinophagaceae bacterium]|nr:hypothetical protein [Chitinophagaceae bacterium]